LVHHREIHFTEWIVRIRDGLPEFIPPQWIDRTQTPRRKALPHLTGLRESSTAGRLDHGNAPCSRATTQLSALRAGPGAGAWPHRLATPGLG
jgi:hypothetical protein